MEGHRIYIYGIVRDAADGGPAPVPPVAGLDGGALRAIAGYGLAAIASAVDLSKAGIPFEEQLKDPDRATALVLEHHRVLQQAIDAQTVLPMRFGALFQDDRGVTDALEKNRCGLMDALGRIDGAREWGVKIFCDRAVAARQLSATSAVVQAAEKELSGLAEGRAFFLRRRLERLRTEETDRAVAHEVDVSRQALCELARASAPLKLQPAAVHGRGEDMVWNGAFLVPRSGEERFLSRLEVVVQSRSDLGLHYEVTGPWPPFSFVDGQLEGGGDACPDGA
ncbi:Gas vesicle synthesis protein GvpL/GvpF [Enhydrobacter aerosaccus]|uniref:Gas vesicle synthesis protein GvpL/GvpF n=1 Tax=Enhydrobacter aerosaccus TaxID=225324 RepID=A0A1T4LV38_9HYPH|nr:GvpL/GvpF family gas vesicle protein [Enhydrobacter aerosaccus]SJZ58610.1 Gas vesicle synthesis protein GvpL/GvpF [Enhydrobacter aerosaccus]